MTPQEREILKNEILNQIEIESRQIEDLTPVSELKEDDLFEINGGRRVAYGLFRQNDGKFLSKIADDVAAGHITFLEGLTAVEKAFFENGAEFGDFISGLHTGTGAAIDKHGNAEVQSIRVRGFMEVMELIVNRLSAIEGDQLLTEVDTIENIVANDDGTYDLYLHPKWEGYFTAQSEGAVLKGIYNTLDEGNGDYYTSWMRVNTVNAPANLINVSLYDDEDVPVGQNFPPVEMMKIARWGHQTDPKRQSCLYLSSTEGRIVKLSNVTKPIIDASNYGATFGSLPDFIYELVPNLFENYDYVYARGLLVQDLRIIDHQGRPLPNYVDCGQWIIGRRYYCDEYNPVSGLYETNDVWHYGCKWRCMKTGTTDEPRWDSPDWAMIEGNPEFRVAFEDTDYLFDPDHFEVDLVIVATLYNQDITDDILDADVVWTRYSEDSDGNPRVASDALWAVKRAGEGKSLHLTREDCDFNGFGPDKLTFTATVTLRESATTQEQTAQASFEY